MIRKIIWFLLAGWLGVNPELSAAPARLAIVAESPVIASVADVLTVELSQKPALQLLERMEVDRVYREQALAAANRDFLKLGQVLGADGLLVLSQGKEGTNQFLEVSLVSVKPGVVLGMVRVPWPVPDPVHWGTWLSGHFSPLFPKLSVKLEEAVPISVINLRSAQSSARSKDLETQLTRLTIERLTREPNVFVLERRRLQLLSTEKELGGIDDSKFWNGSYLLEGVVDRDGYTPDKITLHVTLTPARGGQRVELAMSENRTNLNQLVMSLTQKVMDALKLRTSAPAWSATEEAARYYEEAQWALKWGLIPQARTAVESAWALGKRDMDCASVRINAYLAGFEPAGSYETGLTYAMGLGGENSQLQKLQAAKFPALATTTEQVGKNQSSRWLAAKALPKTTSLEAAIHLLRLYADFSRTLPAEEPKAAWPWHELGLSVLAAGSEVLQAFHFVPEAQAPVKDKLAELRALSREIANWILRSPSVKTSYWFPNSIANRDFLGPSIGRANTIYQCQATYGCFWQEQPEDALTLYRKLMSSPVFSYVHENLLIRDLKSPRLAAWSDTDRRRVSDLWRAFVGELNQSTNPLCRIEAKAFALADLQTDAELKLKMDELFGTVMTHREYLVTNLVETTYGDAGFRYLIGEIIYELGDHMVSPIKDDIERRLHSEYWAPLAKLPDEYRAHKQRLALPKAALESTISVTTSSVPPVIGGGVASLVASGTTSLGRMGSNGPVIKQVQTTGALVPGVFGTTTADPMLKNTLDPEIPRSLYASNALVVRKFLAIPFERLGVEKLGNVRVFSQRIRDGKLIFDVRYTSQQPSYVSMEEFACKHYGAAAFIWDMARDQWQVVIFPHPDTKNRLRVGARSQYAVGTYLECFDGALYVSDWEAIKKLDLKTGNWQSLPFPGQKLAELFAIKDRLFAANDEGIFEIASGGQSTRILASCRRRPAATYLDTLETLGNVTLFPGPEGRVRALVRDNVYQWNGKDWELFLQPGPEARMLVFENSALLFATPVLSSARIWHFQFDQDIPEYCWRQDFGSKSLTPFTVRRRNTVRSIEAEPRWKSQLDSFITKAPAAVISSNVLFYLDRSDTIKGPDKWRAALSSGRHGDLVCLVPGQDRALVVPVQFTDPAGPVPSEQVPFKNATMNFWDMKIWVLAEKSTLIIGQVNLPGVWIVPQSELERAITNGLKEAQLYAEPAKPKPPKPTAPIVGDTPAVAFLKIHDKDHNGLLDLDELEDMREAEKIKPTLQGPKRVLIPPGFMALRMFDTNKDQYLNQTELDNMINRASYTPKSAGKKSP